MSRELWTCPLVNSLRLRLRCAQFLALAFLTSHCSSPRVTREWQHYDPLSQLSAEAARHLEHEASRLEAKLKRDPGDQGALAELADIRFLQGRKSDAVTLYREALADVPPGTRLEHRARFGTALLHAELNSEACEVLEAVLREDPENARALLSYAEYQAEILGNSALAMSLLQRAKQSGAIYISPDFEEALEQGLN